MEYRNSGYRWKNTYPPFHQQEVNTNMLKLLKKHQSNIKFGQISNPTF